MEITRAENIHCCLVLIIMCQERNQGPRLNSEKYRLRVTRKSRPYAYKPEGPCGGGRVWAPEGALELTQGTPPQTFRWEPEAVSHPYGNRLSLAGVGSGPVLLSLSLPYTRNSFVLMKEVPKIQKEEGGQKGEDQVLMSQSRALCPGWSRCLTCGFQNHTPASVRPCSGRCVT